MSASGALGRQFDQYGDSPIEGAGDVELHQRAIQIAVGSRHVDFEKQPVEEFHPHELTPTQRYLWREKHEGVRQASGEAPPVHVVRMGGVHYLRDGHHRWDLARERGTRLRAHVLDAHAPW